MTEPKKRQYVVKLATNVPTHHTRISPGGHGLSPRMQSNAHITTWYEVDKFGMLCFAADGCEVHVPLHLLISITELVE